MTLSSLLGELALLAVLVVGVLMVGRLLVRERLVRTVARQFPEQADEIRRAARSVPLLRAIPAPADPYARTHRIVVAPLGDGRPGEAFWAPGPAEGQGDLGPDGSRTDVRVRLAEGVQMLVVCLGRVGTPSDGPGDPIEPAAERARIVHAAYRPPQQALGPVDPVPTAAGPGWRTTSTFGGTRFLTDTHIDHDGWAFVVGVLSTARHARSVEALDGILSTWRWIPDAQWPPGEETAGL